MWWNSEADYGGIYTRLDKPYYTSGDTVSGTVYLNLIQHYPGTFVHLKLQGKESCFFHTTKQV